MVRWGDLLNVGCLWLLGHGTRNARFYVLHAIRSAAVSADSPSAVWAAVKRLISARFNTSEQRPLGQGNTPLNRFNPALKKFTPDLNCFESGMNPFKSAQQTFKSALNPFKPRLKGFAEMINARNRAFRKFKFQVNPLTVEGNRIKPPLRPPAPCVDPDAQNVPTPGRAAHPAPCPCRPAWQNGNPLAPR